MNPQENIDVLQTIFEAHQDGILLVDEESRVLFANQSAARLLCITLEELTGSQFPYTLRSGVKEVIEIKLEDRLCSLLEIGIVKSELQQPPVFLVTLHDVSDRLLMDEQLRLAAKVFEHTAEGIFITDADANIILVNQAFSDITGWSSAEVYGRYALEIHSDQRDAEFFRQMWSSLAITGQWQGEIWNRRKDGDPYPEWLTICAVRDARGELSNYITIFTDISTRKNTEERLRFLATHDPLTGLPNRDLFHDRLSQALMRARRLRTGNEPKHNLAVLLLDLDNFKTVNDTLGHAAGDQVLIIVAERLRVCVRSSDSVARLGGDEFTVLLEGLSDPQHCEMVAQKILDTLSPPILINKSAYEPRASLGISMYPWDGEDGETLLQNADTAMYHAKKKGHSYQFYVLTPSE